MPTDKPVCQGSNLHCATTLGGWLHQQQHPRLLVDLGSHMNSRYVHQLEISVQIDGGRKQMDKKAEVQSSKSITDSRRLCLSGAWIPSESRTYRSALGLERAGLEAVSPPCRFSDLADCDMQQRENGTVGSLEPFTFCARSYQVSIIKAGVSANLGARLAPPTQSTWFLDLHPGL